jgi:hypothetical protein
MKRFLALAGPGLLLAAACVQAPSATETDGFRFPAVKPAHEHMRSLLANAFGYVKPLNSMIDTASGYPAEGWNQDPERALYLRSFTQLTAIGEWIELLANIAAGYADNPYIARTAALSQLEHTVASLLADQRDPAVSAQGLLGNFLGFGPDGRMAPLSDEVEKQQFIDAFGGEKAESIWNALIARKWIVPQQDGSFAKVPRKGEYGDRFFSGELAPFADSNTRARIMAVLDTRVVQVIFGDNANLTASVARAIGALRHPKLRDEPQAAALGDQLEQFIERQGQGYRHLYDAPTGTFVFGWNATRNRFTGWQGSDGRWVVGRMDYFANEFRAPLAFVVQRYGLPADAVKNCGLKIKPYRMADGRDLYTLATWEGSAFQSFGLALFMQEMDAAGWREDLENALSINLDFSTRHELPGFLSEAYSGNGVEYSGRIGIPDLAITDQPRITDAPSLYTLGVAYEIAPDRVEAFLSSHWKTVRQLFTAHGPWEGFNTTSHAVIEFQTTAHTLALILGGLGSAGKNMQRYLSWRDIASLSRVRGGDAVAADLLHRAQWISWSPLGDSLEGWYGKAGFSLRGDSVRQGAVTIKPPEPVDLSNGALLIRYRAAKPPVNSVLVLDAGPRDFQNEVFLRFDPAETEQEIRIPLPATPGLDGVKELVLRFGDPRNAAPVDLTIARFELVPASRQESLPHRLAAVTTPVSHRRVRAGTAGKARTPVEH